MEPRRLAALCRWTQGTGTWGVRCRPGLVIDDDGSFGVLESDGSRFSYFTVGGQLIETVQGRDPQLSYQGFPLNLHFPKQGVHLALPSPNLSVVVGDGSPPFDRQPLLRVRRSETGRWLDPEPLFWLDYRDRYFAPFFPDGSRMYGAQPYGDADRVRFDLGAAVVMRQREAPGAVELVELSVGGDTVWHRHLQLEPRKLDPRVAQEWLDEQVGVDADRLQAVSGLSRRDVQGAFEAALYRPEYLPAVRGSPVLTASGEVWLITTEMSDTLKAYYVLRRGDMDEAPRRVLVPEWFRLHDATETHVWGLWRDSMDRLHIVGRRLVPAR